MIILGKGPSSIRCERDFVLTFDDIVICNYQIFDRYEKNFPYKADIQYRNKSCKNFTGKEVEKLGLKKIVYTGKPTHKLSGDNNHSLPVEYPDWYTKSLANYNLDPSAGIQAFLDISSKDYYNKICLIGFDMFEIGKKPYYYDKDESPDNLTYLWKDCYIGDKINKQTGHDTHISFDVMRNIIRESDKEYVIMSDFEKFKKLNLRNITLL